MSIAEDCHKWPRGFKKRLIDQDGDKCFFCFTQQKPFDIAHVGDWDKSGLHHFPYLPENRYSTLYTVLLCRSCHMKLDNTHRRDSPFYQGFIRAFRERFEKIKKAPQASLDGLVGYKQEIEKLGDGSNVGK